ncbi:hypothetical protein R1flu_023453 [Riccia fluitans]|uniref:DDE Tnp4 domain-containing protein n=1 Tax=Riccia fluitans TaxID=41844 RepID=A0ABD1XV27_9MARC
MVNYTNRVMTAIECCLKNEISWPNRLERTRIASVFAVGGFPGCIGLVDGTTIKLSQCPAEDGETYFDRKGDYSINAQIISDDRKCIIYFKIYCLNYSAVGFECSKIPDFEFDSPESMCLRQIPCPYWNPRNELEAEEFPPHEQIGMPGSCHDVTCLRQSSLWKRMHSQQQHLLFDRGQYLLGDSGYTSGERLVAAFRNAGGDKDKTDFNTCIAHVRIANEHCIGILKSRWHSLKEVWTQLKNRAENQYLVRWVRCCILLHNFLNRRMIGDDWTEADGPIEAEVESEVQILAPPTPPLDERAMIARGRRRRLEVQSECLAYMRNGNGH